MKYTYLTISLLSIILMSNLAAEGEPTQGSLRVSDTDGAFIEIPLKHTEVQADISGFIVRVDVTQTFVNSYDRSMEAVYVFPLPENSAVDRMSMTIGKRTIRGIIKERDEARQIFEQARNEGRTAGLLEQERPNIFTQSVTNIQPGDTILVKISYVDVLQYEKGAYDFVFPMVVGPRYIPGTPISKNGTGWSPDTDKVPDASRITPPVLKPGERTGHDISISVNLNAGLPVRGLGSKSHAITDLRLSDENHVVTLEKRSVIPNKDFILSYQAAGAEMQTALLTHRAEDAGYFLLIMQPKISYKKAEIHPKEMIFVVDNSGSMNGEPIAKAKEAMRHCIRNMNDDDLFQIIRFSEAASSFSPHPLANNEANRQKGIHFINEMHGGGGTRMVEGIKAALDYPEDPGKTRIVFFMTDGYIGNEAEILREIQDRLGNARLFSFGVGSSVNRFLLDRMALIGRGTVQYVTLDENSETAVTTFYERIANPVLTDLAVDWGKSGVDATYPSKLPDLFSSQPVTVVGRYVKPGTYHITLSGKLNNEIISIPVKLELPKDNKENNVIASIWARNKIKDLKLNDLNGSESTRDEITKIALAHNLMTEYTSFVAVEEQIRSDASGKPMTVTIPVPMPSGVSYEGVFGEGGGRAQSPGKTSARVLQMQSVNASTESANRLMDTPQPFTSHKQSPSPLNGWPSIQQAVVYPERALYAGIDGKVILNVHVSAAGEAIDTKTVSSPHPLLEQASVQAVKSVRWTHTGKSSAWVAVPIIFKVKSPYQEVRAAGRVFIWREDVWVEQGYSGETYTTLVTSSETDWKRLREMHKQDEKLSEVREKLGDKILYKHKGHWFRLKS